ncbi:endonuclease/exonuclease/phosphatase family protein [Nonomuraea gerenzanensis]|uniref:Glycerophosphoryl diester phosphodiesterase n=1 Tax=Nonomuraea gerenzanensis TaxID=93944 RepID=A0A1M4E4U5_9ACTN|nr:endonuclease/exonuclease/phosphatase family protein [Nonomuraea gerenzanensis]UBU16004.1 endonuclease/exonuclease/phosphatase family protein [Nonomuraea gerenzanensis]SBO93804.1 Glycerophosphoryl diester phosphodiesterase [Nonomuraea gerenzanensis]
MIFRCVLAAVVAAAILTPLPASATSRVRFATFNASLNRAAEGQLVSDLSTPGNTQAAVIAEIVQRSRPDVLLINEFDYDAAGQAARLFQDNYLSAGQGGARPISYPYRYTAPSNTGLASGFDLNNDGTVVTTPGAPGYGDDALGFGAFPGQYGMAVYSKYPIDVRGIRTFQNFLWKDMPGNVMPAGWYSAEEQQVLRLSSKSHWDLPVRIGHRTVHFLVSHPTPPTFDGAEDRNGRRNHDEIRLWADYTRPGRGGYLYDDRGRRGGLDPGAAFVIAGDQNADPHDGDSYQDAIHQLLDHPRIDGGNAPSSAGAAEAAALQGGANATHTGDPKHDTADFADTAPGNLRADYVLPSKRLRSVGGGVFWPVPADPLSRLTGVFPFPSSDHRLVWLDVKTP